MYASNGFWQVELDHESSLLTTFNSPFGRYRFLRLPFGVTSASEEYQQRMMQELEGLEGIVIVADDILILGNGSTDREAEINHETCSPYHQSGNGKSESAVKICK